MKQNCWDYKKCGREPGGSKVHELGVCPVATECKLDGIHGGKNSGRTCWVVAGTYCKGEIQGSFAKKFRDCMNCEFYKQVKEEEYPSFILTPLLLKQLNEN
jgi:hypothetical protein